MKQVLRPWIRIFVFFSLISTGLAVKAETVQVPENCINRISPCMVRTDASPVRFNLGGLVVRIQKQSIVKLSWDEHENRFEIFEGRLSLNLNEPQRKVQKPVRLHSVVLADPRVLVSRRFEKLDVLHLGNFFLSHYKVNGPHSELELASSDIVSKAELVGMSRFYFSSMGEFKAFLKASAATWSQSFAQETARQTKVLKRSIASVEERQRATAAEKARKAAQLKKVRDEFFYRTFER
jgi:hypothetical protein